MLTTHARRPVYPPWSDRPLSARRLILAERRARTTMADQLAPLVARLEAVTSRLEGVAPGGGGARVPGECRPGCRPARALCV